MPKEKYIISLGGSLIAPKTGIDTRFLINFRGLIKTAVKNGRSFIIVTGGGRTARDYIQAGNKITTVNKDDSDWLGIHATRLNAHLLRTIFKDIAEPEIITNPAKPLEIKRPVVIAGGYRPGNSTDYVAVMLAEKYGIKTIINLSNIDFVYDKDPKKYINAKKISSLSWTQFIKIVGTKWDPGLNAPFDPVASQKARTLKLKVVILNGKKIKNLENCLNNKTFFGTTIA